MSKPSGFIAECQCGEIVGALDYERTDRKDSGKILGQWLHKGFTVRPKFGGSWHVEIKPCKCNI